MIAQAMHDRRDVVSQVNMMLFLTRKNNVHTVGHKNKNTKVAGNSYQLGIRKEIFLSLSKLAFYVASFLMLSLQRYLRQE